MNRYFIVSYIGTHSSGSTLTGQTSFICIENTFLNKKEIYKQLSKLNTVSNPVVTFILELNEADYNEWMRK